MYKLIKIKLHIAIVITLILFSVVASLSSVALTDFLRYKKAVDPSLSLDIKRFHYFLKNVIEKEKIKYEAPRPLADNESKLKTFHISIDQKDILKLNANLPESGKEQDVDAYMKVSDDKETKKIKLRYRGDNNYHWLYDQKSLRIKLSSNETYDMEKTFNLINPPSMYSFRDVVNYDISKKVGLISPDCYPVRVEINGKYMGVYLYTSQVDESLIRKHKLMPGSIYYGDLMYNGEDRFLWRDANLWDKKSSRNAEQKNNKDDIEFFINAITKYDDLEFYEFAENFLNKEKFFHFIALDRIFGSNHHEYTHNHKLYFDPYKGKFEPISWDIRFWLNLKEKDLSIYPLQLKIASNPIYDAKIDKIVFDLINDGIYEKIATGYKDVINSLMPDLKSDIYRDRAINLPYISNQAVSEPFEIKQLEDLVKADLLTLQERKTFLSNLFDSCVLSYDIQALASKQFKLILDIDGNSPASVDFSSLENVEIYRIVNNEKYKANNLVVIYPNKTITPNTQKLFPVAAWGTDTVKSSIQRYEFIINAATANKNINAILSKIVYKNYITNKPIVAAKTNSNFINIQTKENSWKYTNYEQKKKVLSGTVEVKKTLVFDKFTSVSIKAGTVFKIYPNQSIYFYGIVKALGTKEKPIKFIAKDTTKPWGLVAVQGKSASGSVFRYCEFKDGSVDTRNLIHYTAPFNIHELDGFEVSHSKIGVNFLGDDAMHIAYSKGTVDSCFFENARSDGLDIDISDVNITNNIFYNSGNDGLDIMTTKMYASNNLFINTGDKGISVGEWSEVSINNSYFLNNEIGLEIKDKSKVVANNLIFKNAKQKAINLYNKNKRYNEGGTLNAKAIYLIGNTKISKDKKSKYNIKLNSVNDLPSLSWYKDLYIKVKKYE